MNYLMIHGRDPIESINQHISLLPQKIEIQRLVSSIAPSTLDLWIEGSSFVRHR